MKLSPLPNTVVHLKTQAEYDEYMQMCEEAGWKWCSGRKPLSGQAKWDRNICVDVENPMAYASKKYCEEEWCTILTLPELKAKFAPKKKKPKPTSYPITSPDQLKHGMRVTCEMNCMGEWQQVEDAKISVDKNGWSYICQNVSDGAQANDMLGYKGSRWVSYYNGGWTSIYNKCIRNLRALESPPQALKPTNPDTWHQDAIVYRRGSDWITAEKACVDGKEYTTEELKAQEAKFRAVRRAQASYFPKAK